MTILQVGQEGNYVLDCCTEILRCIPQDSSEDCMIVRHEMSNLYGIGHAEEAQGILLQL